MSGRATAVRQATAWLGDPVTVVALVVLLLNDHLLKPAYGTWWTGKLSDVAGLVVAPPLVGLLVALVVPRLPARSVAATAVAMVGAGFAVVKGTSVGAVAASAVWTWVAGPARVLPDRTDLVALPALALALWAGRRSGARSEQQSPRWFRLVVVLPVAVLAVGATSQSPLPMPRQVATVGTTLYVGVSQGEADPSAWYGTSDGVSWDDAVMRYQEDEYDDIAARVAAAGGPTTLVCDPDDQDVCYRAGQQEGLLVERSLDGGQTWAVDWCIPDGVADELRHRYSEVRAPFDTSGVAMLLTPAGPAVYAVNGGDGLAVRRPNGVWERLGLPYLESPEPAVPLPGEWTSYDYPIPPLVVLVLTAACLVLLVRWRLRLETAEPPTRSIRVVLGIGAPIVCLAVALDVAMRVVRGQSTGYSRLLLVPLFVGGATLLLGGLAALGRRPRGGDDRPDY